MIHDSASDSGPSPNGDNGWATAGASFVSDPRAVEQVEQAVQRPRPKPKGTQKSSKAVIRPRDSSTDRPDRQSESPESTTCAKSRVG